MTDLGPVTQALERDEVEAKYVMDLDDGLMVNSSEQEASE